MISVHSFGPIYWGTELPLETEVGELRKSELPDQRWLTYSWFVEDASPYRKSLWGFRVKGRSYWALHVGICRKADEPPHKQLVHISPSDIGAWGRKQEGDGDAVHEEATDGH